jgi:hypothetical protein
MEKHPDMKLSSSRSARIFLSSTFRDFGEERDLLVRKVFPSLRERLKDRFKSLNVCEIIKDQDGERHEN